MKTSPSSQPTLFDEMASTPSTLSRAVSRVRIYHLQESKRASSKVRDLDYGPKSTDLLASYDLNTSSWKTSQTCLLVQPAGLGLGLEEFSGTWPSAGMMLSGKTYRRQPWALPIAESARGLLPTPRKAMHRKSYLRAQSHRNLEEILGEIGLIGSINPSFCERMMGFPATHTELVHAEMQSSHLSQSSSEAE